MWGHIETEKVLDTKIIENKGTNGRGVKCNRESTKCTKYRLPNIDYAKYNIDQPNITSIHYTPPSLYIRYITSLE